MTEGRTDIRKDRHMEGVTQRGSDSYMCFLNIFSKLKKIVYVLSRELCVLFI